MNCVGCGYPTRPDDLVCPLCGRIRRRGLEPARHGTETRRLTAYPPPSLPPFELVRRVRIVRHGWALLFLGLLSVGTGLFVSGMTAARGLPDSHALEIQYGAGLVFGAFGLGAILARSRLAAGTGFCVFLADTALFAYVAGTSPIPHLLAGPLLVRLGFLFYWGRD